MTERAIPDADYSIELDTALAPESAYAAIHRIQDWWMAELRGSSRRIGDEFSYDLRGHSCAMRVVQLVPGRRIVWRVIRSHMTGVADPEEWVGTDITFEIEKAEDGSRVRFTHVGLEPTSECYDRCAAEWEHSITAGLRRLLEPAEVVRVDGVEGA